MLVKVGGGLGHNQGNLRCAGCIKAEATGQSLGVPACLTHS